MMKSLFKLIFNKFINSMGYEVINKNQKIIELSKTDEKLINLVSNYSMTPKIRIFNLLQSLRHLKYNKIPGDYVECGVWKGGNIILFKKFIENEDPKSNKKIFAFDTFEGMTSPDENDFDLLNKTKAKNLLKKDRKKKTNDWGFCSIEDVKINLKKNLRKINNIKLIKGPVEKTLDKKKNLPNKISLLRLDTDWYSSTRKELETLYDKVSSGGIIIIDDYGHWGGAKKAVDEFFSNKYVWMHYVDYACRLIIKK